MPPTTTNSSSLSSPISSPSWPTSPPSPGSSWSSTSDVERAQNWYDTFKEHINSPEAEIFLKIRRREGWEFSPEEKDIWSKLNRKLNVRKEKSQGNTRHRIGGQGTGLEDIQEITRERTSTSDWVRHHIMTLKGSDAAECIVNVHVPDPISILDFDISMSIPAPGPPGTTTAPFTSTDIFLARVQYTRDLQSLRAHSNVTWRFLMLFWYDFCQLFRPSTGRLAGRISIAQLEKILLNVRSARGDQLDPIVITATAAEIQKWCAVGRNVYNFFIAFDQSPGALLFCPSLRPYFFENCWTCTGESHNAAVEHLRSIGLVESAHREAVASTAETLRSELFQDELKTLFVFEGPTTPSSSSSAMTGVVHGQERGSKRNRVV